MSALTTAMTTSPTTKRVRWSTVTVYEFGVAIGGSAVPKRGGPAVGLAKTPECVWHTTVDAVRRTPLRAFDPNAIATACEPMPRLCSREQHNASPRESCRQRKRKRRRVRWLKPLERVRMLERAGFSEKRIYCMLMESSHIVMSRRLCLRLPFDASR